MTAEWLLKFLVLWFNLSLIILVTSCYLAETIRQRYPDWWRKIVVDDEPGLMSDQSYHDTLP